MIKSKSGFTIVELLIVIVIIAILATITVVAYNGVQTKARNAATLNESAQWSKAFKAYYAAYGNMPNVPLNYYCLGSGFPVGYGGTANCRDYNTSTSYVVESNNATLMAELAKVSTLPKGDRTPIGGSVGPFIYIDVSQSNPANRVVDIITVLRGSSASECPSTQSLWYTDNATRVFCVERIVSP